MAKIVDGNNSNISEMTVYSKNSSLYIYIYISASDTFSIPITGTYGTKITIESSENIFTDVLIISNLETQGLIGSTYDGVNCFSPCNEGERPFEYGYLYGRPNDEDESLTICPVIFTINDEFPDEPDYNEKYFYTGTYSLDGTLYDRWDKYEGAYPDNPTLENVKQYFSAYYSYSVLTNRVVSTT